MKNIGLGLALMLVLLLLSACGVPQEQYNKLNSDLAAAQAQIQTLQSDLTAKESDLKATQEKIVQATSKMEVLNAIFIPAMKGELNNMTQTETVTYFFTWRDKVNAIGDPVLTSKFQSIIDSGGADEVTLSFFLYLLENIPKTLE